MGLSAWRKVSAVNAFVRSIDLSHSQTNHHASRPKTTKEKKVWTPKTAKASMHAILACDWRSLDVGHTLRQGRQCREEEHRGLRRRARPRHRLRSRPRHIRLLAA